MTFKLHSDLIRDGIDIGSFGLCRVLLINDATYPWFVLVPQTEGLKDTVDMTDLEHATLWQESKIFGSAIMDIFSGEKLNVAALGNMTPQLHIHHIVRYTHDAAWPGPIWGVKPLTPYDSSAVDMMKEKFRKQNIRGFNLA